MKRLTDKRFLSDGFYQPKSKEEFKEIQTMKKPTYEELYKRLGEYENLGLTAREIKDLLNRVKQIRDDLRQMSENFNQKKEK